MLPLITGAAALASAGFLSYHSIAPQSQFFGQTFIGTPGRGRKLALTYDDGPNDPDTLHLLDVLDSHHVKATFFLIGKYVAQRPDIVRRLVEGGHEIGNHTFSHPVLALVSKSKQVEELARCEAALLDAGVHSSHASLGEAPSPVANSLAERIAAAKLLREATGTTLFRAPFGARRAATLSMARKLGYVPVQWTVTCFDWKRTTSGKVEKHAIRQIAGGDIILMHDGGHKTFGANRSHTVEATDRIVARYKDQDFEFVTVTEMMNTTRASAPNAL
jgi:peptidoglycan/xylan/chitin deacetylase (PgdA/CDA1 family)